MLSVEPGVDGFLGLVGRSPNGGVLRTVFFMDEIDTGEVFEVGGRDVEAEIPGKVVWSIEVTAMG